MGAHTFVAYVTDNGIANPTVMTCHHACHMSGTDYIIVLVFIFRLCVCVLREWTCKEEIHLLCIFYR